jgi:hypothetical protein
MTLLSDSIDDLRATPLTGRITKFGFEKIMVKEVYIQ